MKFIITGGEQRKNAVWSEEWNHYNSAKAILLDWDTGEVCNEFNYTSPIQRTSGNKANIVFKAGSLKDNTLYLCTQTEILLLNATTFEVDKEISNPFFNDLHHVIPYKDGLCTTVTGLDMIAHIGLDSSVHSLWNSLGKDPWHKFSKETDYRKIETTKPHESHPNYIFELNNELWATRFEQRDAVQLSNFNHKINIAHQRVHDGFVYKNNVYFTTVNGLICSFDSTTFQETGLYDINKAYNRSNPLGWCRSLHIEDDTAFVGFSSLRSTKLRENLAWVKRGFKGGVDDARALPTRVTEYNMKSKKIVKEIDLSIFGMAAVFSIIKVPD